MTTKHQKKKLKRAQAQQSARTSQLEQTVAQEAAVVDAESVDAESTLEHAATENTENNAVEQTNLEYSGELLAIPENISSSSMEVEPVVTQEAPAPKRSIARSLVKPVVTVTVCQVPIPPYVYKYVAAFLLGFICVDVPKGGDYTHLVIDGVFGDPPNKEVPSPEMVEEIVPIESLVAEAEGKTKEQQKIAVVEVVEKTVPPPWL